MSARRWFCIHEWSEWWNFVRGRKQRSCDKCGARQVFSWGCWQDADDA